MITPGEFSIELIFDPITYLILTISFSIILCMFSAYVSDMLADEAKKVRIKNENPNSDLSNIWELENGDKLSLMMGFLTAIVFVLPLIDTIDTIGGFFGILSISVLFGWGARKILPSLANSFIDKRISEIK